ncbi:long-chain acyl-CoA synthetase [Cladophialophora psammophila CBS 110553]|uniref:Long-chain acyl-CoA synthetase n=1 Tax=Cladophialophora psammophila CBS 110553 TaxID=1182543 RepID=W9VGY7_9EURO|nr:long-chain acyl-CoA synthetase [Cladophialophora psammophila CBS 110553]EXJ54877.1 long-chain acyl-CoA synthetase [Cladophialophora psammophila CBS 110553]
MSLESATETTLFPSPTVLSLLHGNSEVPLLDFTLGELLDFQCKRYGSKECLVVPWTGARWTYGRLREESIRLAKALVARGLRPGDRIGIMAGNCEQYVSVFFACMKLGCILVILNNTYTASEAMYALKFTECRILFATPRIGHHDNGQLLRQLREKPGTVEEIIILQGPPSHFTPYATLLETGAVGSDEILEAASKGFSCHAVCNLQFTSGTTGNPKAAMLTHHSLVNNSRFIGDRMALTDQDVLCCPPPLFHCFGLVLGLLAIITHGGKVVYPAETFDAVACLRAISEERCTALHGVPAMFDSIFSLPRPEDFDCSALRTGIIAGAPVPRHLMELMVNELGMTEFTSSYGLTEASPTCFNAFHNDPTDLKLTTVGQVMPHAHAKIVDRHGGIVPVGERGELCIAGYQLQRGYWRNADKTNEVMIRDGDGVLWLHTGDEAVFHRDKTCSITGRFKDIIIRGGENIYPLEIESRLVQHEAIDRAIVVGVKHARYGEIVAAFLQRSSSTPATTPRGGSVGGEYTTPTARRPSDENIREWVRLKLGRHKAPAHIFWLGEDDIPATVPLTGSGKVRKFELAQLAGQLVTQGRPKL